MAEELKIQIGADTSQFNAELQKAENELKQFQNALKKTTDIKALEQLNAQILKTQQTIAGFRGSMQTVATSSGRATQSLTDLSRVVQDAPFGFIGIANNLNPLVEGFVRLNKETKNSGGAFKALLSALSGPAGLGIALAAVSSAITFAQIGFDRWFKSSKSAADSTKELRDELVKAEQSAISNGIRLEGLVNVITNVTESEKNRNLALEEANKLLGPYGQKIDSINISVEKAKELTDAYTEALINQAVGAKLADKIADLRIKKNELLLKQGQIQTSQANAQAQQTAQANKLVERSFSRSDFASYQYLQTVNEISTAQADLVNVTNELAGVQNEINRLTSQYNATITQTLKTDVSKKVKKDGETIESVLAKLREDLRDQRALSVTFNTDTLPEQIKLVYDTISKLVTDFNLKDTDKRIIELQAQLSDLSFEKLAQDSKKAIQNAIKTGAGEEGLIGVEIELPPVDLKAQAFTESLRLGLIEQIRKDMPFDLFKDKNLYNMTFESLGKFWADWSKKNREELAKKKAELAAAYQETILGAVNESIGQIGEIIGEGLFAAISGAGGGIKEAFAGLFAIFGDALIRLGKYAISYSKLIETLKKVLSKAQGIPGIAVGIALIALGTLIKKATSGLGRATGFAVGTRFAPGGLALVGERGPELVNIPRGSQVIPAAQTANMMGGVGQSIEVFGVLRGQDIYFSNKKYGQTYNRTT